MARTRLQISMSPELEDALRDLQDATGLAMASFVSEVMEHNISMIKSVAEAARAAKTAPGEWLIEMLRRTMTEAIREAEGQAPEDLPIKPVVRPYKRRSVRPVKVAHGKA